MADNPTPHTQSARERVLRATVSGGSVTGVAKAPVARGLEAQIVALPDPLRLQMSLVARKASSSDEALEPVLRLLVPGSPAKLAAIAQAFRTNEPMREQWERTFEILRA
jgi:hypothetical protein